MIGRGRSRPAAVVAFLVVSAVAGSPTEAAAQKNPAEAFPRALVLGRRVQLLPAVGRLAPEGELLAVGSDSLWIVTEGERRAYPLAGARAVRVQRHGLTTGRILGYTLVAGAISTGALTAACSSLDDSTSCGVVFGVNLGAWLVVGGLAARALGSSSRVDVPPRPELLRPYARFPQGLPSGLRLPSEGPGRDGGAPGSAS